MFEVKNIVKLPDGSVMAYGIAPMEIPSGAHVRQVSLSVPKTLFIKDVNPTVTTTVVGEGSVGEAFVVHNLTFDHNQTNILVIKVTATNMKIGATSALKYLCNFMIVGKAP